jgi:hypothetical protein
MQTIGRSIVHPMPSMGSPATSEQLPWLSIVGGFMEKKAVLIISALLCSGCVRQDVSGPDEVRSRTEVVQVVLIDGFGDNSSMLTSSTYVRVGTYYDFRPYDSLRISFTVTRLNAELPFDEILVRIGPTACLRDSVYATQERLSLGVTMSTISKTSFCALSFLAQDSRALLRLSDLRVVGWMTK